MPPSLPLPALPAAPDAGEAPVKGVTLQERGVHTLTLTWPAPKPPLVGYRVELRHFYLDDAKVLQSEWDQHPSVYVEPATGGTVRATLRGLPAGLSYTVRVVAVDSRGSLSRPSAQFQATTLPEPRWWHAVTPLRALLGGLVGCLYLRWRRKQLYG